MYTIFARNVNDAFAKAQDLVADLSTLVPTRTGDVWRLRRSLTVRFRSPRERVLFDPARNANPFFHLFEALWLLDGRSDVAWLAGFNERMRTFSEDGVTLPASYGVRWRAHFGVDQLRQIESLLRRDPGTRRAVLQMWDGGGDLELALRAAPDVPCNLSAVFQERDEGLCVTVFNRSNDLGWGLFGANVVQFSMLLEYLAARLGLHVGYYEHITADPHIYPDHWSGPLPDGPYTRPVLSAWDGDQPEPYSLHEVAPSPLIREPEAFEEDLLAFLDPRWEEAVFSEPFFAGVARPMRRAWLQRRINPALAQETASQIAATDWRRASVEWLTRFAARLARKEA